MMKCFYIFQWTSPKFDQDAKKNPFQNTHQKTCDCVVYNIIQLLTNQ